jgi:hypothetical protein
VAFHLVRDCAMVIHYSFNFLASGTRIRYVCLQRLNGSLAEESQVDQIVCEKVLRCRMLRHARFGSDLMSQTQSRFMNPAFKGRTLWS